MQIGRDPFRHGHVPATDEQRSDGGHVRVQAGDHATLDAADVCLCRRQIVLAREEERHVDRDAGEDGVLDCRVAGRGARDLDIEIWTRRPSVEVLGCRDGARRVVRQSGRDLERDPAVHAIGRLVDRAEEVGCHGQVFEGELEEERELPPR